MAVNRHDDHDEVRLSELEQPLVRHESADVNVWAVGRFGIALVFLCILSLGLLFGLFKYFQSTVGGTLPDINVDARRLPPQPQLQRDSDSGSASDARRGRSASHQLWLGRSIEGHRAGADQRSHRYACQARAALAAARGGSDFQRQRSHGRRPWS